MHQAAGLGEDRRLERRPARGGAAQVDGLFGQFLQRFAGQREPGFGLFVEAEETTGIGSLCQQFATTRELRRLVFADETRQAFDIEHQHARGGPKPVERGLVDAKMIGAVEAAMPECVKPLGHAEKLLPQPQVVFAFGLRITNCEPCRLSR